jgi:hypothetical protein
VLRYNEILVVMIRFASNDGSCWGNPSESHAVCCAPLEMCREVLRYMIITFMGGVKNMNLFIVSSE